MRLLLLLLLPLSGCAQAKSDRIPLSYCGERNFEGDRFTVCDNEGGKFRLFAAGKDETPVRSFAGLMRRVDSQRVAFAMNAGMFDEKGRPIGYAVVGGHDIHKLNLRDGPGNFHLKPNGVFVVDAAGKAAIYTSDSLPAFRVQPLLATQSGPMLVIAGKLHPKLDPDGTSRFIRNGVGITQAGRAVFVISGTSVSLGKFARFFRDSLKTPNALYFDGSVSALWDPVNARQDRNSELGPMIVAFRPEKESKPGRGAHARP